MKPLKLLIAGCVASSLFTFYSAIQSGFYYNKFKSDSYYSNQPKFSEISNLVDDAQQLISYEKNIMAGIYLQKAENKFNNISPELSESSAIDDFLREVSVDLQKPNCDPIYQLDKLDMVHDELDSIKRNYLSQSKARENLDRFGEHFRNTAYSLISSAVLLLLFLRFARRKHNY